MKPTPILTLMLLLAGARTLPAEDPGPTGSRREALVGVAEDLSVVAMTLSDAVDRARRNSARLAQLRALERAAKAGFRGARAGRLPQLELSAGYTRNSDVPELTLALGGGGTRTIFPNIPDNSRTRAAVTLPLYTGGRVDGTIRAAERQRSAAERDLDAGDLDLVLETRTAYWSLVTALETERVLREALASYAGHLKDARNRLESGLTARSEVLAVQVDSDRAELIALQAASAVAIAQADLQRLLGLPPTARVDPTERAETAPVAAELAESLTAAAVAARPELAALRARLEASEANVKVQRSATRPQAGLTGSYDYANPNTRILPLKAQWKGTWSVGINVAWNAFDGGRASAAAAQTSAQAEALRHQLEDLERRVRLEVTARLLEVGTASAAIQVAARATEAARENLRVNQDRYREGVSASSDLLDAEAALLRAQLDQTESATRLRLVLARLDRARGR